MSNSLEWKENELNSERLRKVYNFVNWLMYEMQEGRVQIMKTPMSIAFVKLAEKGDIDEVTASEHTDLFLPWATSTSYAIGDLRSYEGILYKCLQAHTSQDDWTPDVAVSLFACLLIDEEGGTIQEWTQPDSTNGYVTGDIVSHNGKFYKSMVDNNVWEPGTTGAPWKECDENGNNVVSEYVAGTVYAAGDQVMYNGSIYTSLIDNNSWSPDGYPAGWQLVE